ncbi:MAG: hypothetical protein OEM41_02410, partial [Ignavibacteria bacterium]|nr:hypothetical protein [Ignavibacteria bacterium]
MKKPGTRKRLSTVGERNRKVAAPTSFSAAQIIDALTANRLFKGIPRTLIAPIAPGIRVKRYSAGELVFDESTRGRNVFLVASGRV